MTIAYGACGPTFQGKSANTIPAFLRMRAAGLTEYRCQFALSDDAFNTSVRSLRRMQILADDLGITLRPILQPPFAFGDRTDNGRHPAAPAGGHPHLYAQGYDKTSAFVSKFPEIEAWELSNEVNLLPTVNGSPLFGKGQTAKEFEAFPVMFDWINVLRGMANAVNYVGAKCTVGTTSTMFGFLDLLKNYGVRFNRISYHMYDKFGANPHHYWNGTQKPFDLFKKLDSYGVPVTINELNAGDVYGEPFGGPMDEAAALKSLRATLGYLTDGTFKNLHSILFYCLIDEPEKAVPENRFGLFCSDWTEKPVMQVVREFSNQQTRSEK